MELLPWLAQGAEPQPGLKSKLALDPAALLPQALGERAVPGLILFPRVSAGSRCAAGPISPAAALQRILPNSLLASQSEVSRAHFEALASLVGQSRCYELALGDDLDSLPALVRGWLARPGPT
jgi:hypothetical protein